MTNTTTAELTPVKTGAKTKWVIDPAHSEIAFKVKHLLILNIKGVFKEFDASIYTTGDEFMTAEIDFWMNPSSVDTGNEKRNEHLIGPDFFDVANHKQISFTGNTLEKTNIEGIYLLYGELAVKGISKQIKLDVDFNGTTKDPWGYDRAVFAIKGKINRNDWELDWDGALNSSQNNMHDDLTISCEVELIRQKAA